MLDPMMNASPGLIKFMRAGLECKMDYGDGDIDDEHLDRGALMVSPLRTSGPTRAVR